MKITAIIITQDEERNIARCLDSLAGIADEVVVVDSGSTDATPHICSHYKSRFSIFNFQFHKWEGYDRQKNYANSLATHPWILSIDADEALSPPLRKNLLALKSSDPDPAVVFCVNRLTHYCGHPIRHCGWYPERKERLFYKDLYHWDGIVHEHLRPTNPQQPINPTTQQLKGDLLHYPYHTPGDLKNKYDKYAALMAEKYHSQGRHATPVDPLLRPLWTFLRNYILLLGFLDGPDGWHISKMSARYTYLKYSQLRKK